MEPSYLEVDLSRNYSKLSDLISPGIIDYSSFLYSQIEMEKKRQEHTMKGLFKSKYPMIQDPFLLNKPENQHMVAVNEETQEDEEELDEEEEEEEEEDISLSQDSIDFMGGIRGSSSLESSGTLYSVRILNFSHTRLDKSERTNNYYNSYLLYKG